MEGACIAALLVNIYMYFMCVRVGEKQMTREEQITTKSHSNSDHNSWALEDAGVLGQINRCYCFIFGSLYFCHLSLLHTRIFHIWICLIFLQVFAQFVYSFYFSCVSTFSLSLTRTPTDARELWILESAGQRNIWQSDFVPWKIDWNPLCH